MGDSRKQRKKFNKPSHPWTKERIEKEIELVREYGLKNKEEIWRADSNLSKTKSEIKKLIGSPENEQTKKELNQILNKLIKLNLITKDAKPEDILSLTSKDFLERRLSTQLFRMGLCRSAKQARQFIVHGHVMVNGKKMDKPSYLVKIEDNIEFKKESSLNDKDHPERSLPKTKEEKPKKEENNKKPKEEKPKAEDKKKVEEKNENGKKELPKKE
jgi:small subunit ribosomal protein S4